MNQLIVKTASFIAKQGLQAEILLKTKQSTNSQFDFLNYENHLNSYYKHLIQLIRANKIDPLEFLKEPEKEAEKPEPEPEPEDQSDDDDQDNYLHPLLSNGFNSSIIVKTTPERVESPKVEEPSSRSPEDKQTEVKAFEELNNFQEEDETMEEPIGKLKIMIDKLAEYVHKNGIDFEVNLVKKNDERFEFLNENNKFNKYYRLKVKSFENVNLIIILLSFKLIKF